MSGNLWEFQGIPNSSEYKYLQTLDVGLLALLRGLDRAPIRDMGDA